MERKILEVLPPGRDSKCLLNFQMSPFATNILYHYQDSKSSDEPLKAN